MLPWLHAHILMLSVSLGAGLLAALGGTTYLIRMPPDMLTRKPRAGGRTWPKIARNILAWLLIIAGIAMIPLPAPGIIIAVLGITLADFPGKPRLQRWLLSRRHITGPINRLRKRFGQPALKLKKTS